MQIKIVEQPKTSVALDKSYIKNSVTKLQSIDIVFKFHFAVTQPFVLWFVGFLSKSIVFR